MDENEKTKDSTKKAAQTAANMYAGPIAGQAVDALSKTKLGDAVLAKGAESLKRNNPQLAKALNKANDTGALDAATAISGSGASGAPSSSGSAPASSGTSPSSSMGLGSGGALASKSKGLFGSSSSDTSSSESDSSLKTTGDKVKKIKKWLPILGPIIGWFLIILIGVCGIIAFVVGPADTVIQFFRDKWEDLKTLVGYKSEEDWELEYYKRLEEVQDELNYKYGVCIDVNLITATLTVDMGTDELVEDGHPEENEDETGVEVESKYDYKKMIKQVELLGTMQIKRKLYGLDQKVAEKNKDKVHESTRDGLPVTVSIPAGKDYCREEEEEPSEYALLSDEDPYLDVDPDERIKKDFNLSDAKYLSELRDKVRYFAERFKGTPVRNSKNARYVAANDIQPGIFKFFAKKSNEEKNIQYTFYVPAYIYEPHYDQNSRIDGYIKKCELDLPQSSNDFAELDIGSLNDYENNVYYWNLIDNFIEEYYADYLPHTHGDEDVVELEEGWISTESEAYQKIKNIAEDIYLLYNEMGPNQTCESSQYICRSDEGADYYGGGELGTISDSEVLSRVSPIAIEEMERTGVDASITLAQFTLESAWGKSGLSTKYSNYFGMTSGCINSNTYPPSGYVGKVLKPGEDFNTCSGNAFWDGTVVAMCNKNGGDCQWYRVYDSLENSVRDHTRLLVEKYGCNSGDYVEQITCIQSHGYATDEGYVNKIINQVRAYNMDEYDIAQFDGTIEDIDGILYDNQLCYYGSSGALGEAGPYDNWKQFNPPWADIKIANGMYCKGKNGGPPCYPKTVHYIGCAATSVAIQIARSGVSTNISNFNPGTFVEAMKSVGGFSSGGDISWSAVSKIAPGFHYEKDIRSPLTPNQIGDYISQGYYVVLNVKNGGHFVAVTSVEGNKILMDDPGSYGTEVGAQYGLGSITGARLFRAY